MESTCKVNTYYELRDLLEEASECGFDICDETDRQLLAEWLIDRGVEVNL